MWNDQSDNRSGEEEGVTQEQQRRDERYEKKPWGEKGLGEMWEQRQEDEEKGRKKRENMESAVGDVMLRKFYNTGGTRLFEPVK